MSKRMRSKAAFVIFVEIICLLFLGIFLLKLQDKVTLQNEHQDMQDKVSQITGLITTADESADQGTKSYDVVYQAKAATVAYIAQNSVSYEETDDYMQLLADKMNVTNILILDKTGNVIASATDPLGDFTRDRFNQLRTVYTTEENSEAFQVDYDGILRRYYAAKIDDDREAVIEHDPYELTDLVENTNSWKAVLSKISVGSEGFAFVVSSQDYTIQYHPDDSLIGSDALALGIRAGELENDHYGWMTIDGKEYYSGVAKEENNNAYVVCVVPKDEITSGTHVTVAIVWFIFFIVITVVVVYALLLLNSEERNAVLAASAKDRKKDANATQDQVKKKLPRYYFDSAVAAKIGTVALAGLVVIVAASLYMQTLFSISIHSVNNLQSKNDVEAQLAENTDEIALLKEQYNRRYLNKCQMAAYILNDNRQLWNKDDMESLRKAINVNKLFIFDKNGSEVMSNSGRSDFSIKEDTESQSYAFKQLLQGATQVIQDASPEDVTGEYYQFIGVPIYDEEGNVDGFVQIRLKPERLQEALATTTLKAVLGGVNPGTHGFAFAVSKDEETRGNFLYYPTEKLIGRSAMEYGMKENQLKDGYNDYIKLEGKIYYATSLETDDGYIYIAVPKEEMTSNRVPVTLAITLVSFICLFLVFLILSFNRRTELSEVLQDKEEQGGPMIDVVMPDGTVQKTEAVTSRWSNLSIHWDDKTPEQRLGTVLVTLCSLLAVIICGGVIFKDKLFDSNSIFLYIINGEWERGISIFSITACFMIICVGVVIMMILVYALKFLSRTMGARAATICRLLRSLVKYVGVIALLYYCFAMFGVDTATLLASAGILSLVIGLGAKALIEDILAGLFIIFEGEFRVGDIITIGDWRGTVVEIGVRTTKVESPGKDVKVFSNRSVSGVINMTRGTSVAGVDVVLKLDESIERVESILATELPKIKKRLPSIIEGPYYRGVTALAETTVTIKIVAVCAESDRMQLVRDLNREMKIICDKYYINIPAPQINDNQPAEYHQEPTALEKYKAEKFNEEQKELSQDIQEHE